MMYILYCMYQLEMLGSASSHQVSLLYLCFLDIEGSHLFRDKIRTILRYAFSLYTVLSMQFTSATVGLLWSNSYLIQN